MKIAMLYPNLPPFDWTWHDQRGLGGSENGMLRTAQHLAQLGHEVHVFNRAELPITQAGENLWWANLSFFNPKEYYDVVYSLRHKEPFEQYHPLNTKLKVLFLADTESKGLGETVHQLKVDLVMAVSHWQIEKIQLEEHIHNDHWMVTSNGVMSLRDETISVNKVQGRCIFLSTPERGLTPLLDIWPKIKSAVPWASLHLYSSFMGWGVSREENENMCRDIYARIDSMANLGVLNCKHGAYEEICLAQSQAEAYLYPSDFYETCGMGILESMYTGTIPVATGRAGLLEKITNNVTGKLIPAYGADSPRYQKMFAEAAIDVLKRVVDDNAWKSAMREACMKYASQFTYPILVREWVNEWQRRIKEKS